MESILDLLNEAMSLQLERGKPTTLFLLTGYNNKLIPTDSMLSPLINASLSSHWRSFFLQQWQLMETYSWSMFIE